MISLNIYKSWEIIRSKYYHKNTEFVNDVQFDSNARFVGTNSGSFGKPCISDSKYHQESRVGRVKRHKVGPLVNMMALVNFSCFCLHTLVHCRIRMA